MAALPQSDSRVGAAVATDTSLGRRTVRLVVALHRYLGTALCLVFLAWFASGIVMMYAGYPLLGESEKLGMSRALDAASASLTAEEAYRRSGIAEVPRYVRLAAHSDGAAYLLQMDAGWLALSATDGRVLRKVDRDAALQIAARFAPQGTAPTYEGLLTSPDQWTIFTMWAPYLPSHGFEPFHKVALGDGARTELSILESTGELTQQTTRSERFWGYVGAVVHWIYPTSLRANRPAAWNDVVVWLSTIGTALCVSGLIVGVYFYRWRRSAGVSASPYRGWMAWHHWAGLIFGMLAGTWVFSGLLSMDPWGWSTTDDSPDGSQLDVMRAGPLDLAGFRLSPAAAISACESALEVKELRLIQLRGEAYYLCVQNSDRTMLVAAGEEAAGTPEPFERFSTETLTTAAAALLPRARVASAGLMTGYDAYYYPGWYDKLVNDGRARLPILRLVFDDAQQTLVYVDPHSGTVTKSYDSSGRWFRWLFHGLHNFDFAGLYGTRPLWDVVVLSLMLGGMGMSLTGTWIAYKWLRRKLRFLAG